MTDQLVLVTKKTPLEELIERFNSQAQARFYIEHLGGSFEEYEAQHARYATSVTALRRQLPRRLKQHIIERAYLPNYLFTDKDLVIPIGPDGLVVNTRVSQLVTRANRPRKADGTLSTTHAHFPDTQSWLGRSANG